MVRSVQGKLAEGKASSNWMCMVTVWDSICCKRGPINSPQDATLESSRIQRALSAIWVQLQIWDEAELWFSEDTKAWHQQGHLQRKMLPLGEEEARACNRGKMLTK